MGIVVNTKTATPSETLAEPTVQEVELQMAYVDNQWFNGYVQIVDHAHRWKVTFDKEVLAHPPWEVIFRARDLVQIYRSDLDFTLSTRASHQQKPELLPVRDAGRPSHQRQVQLKMTTSICTKKGTELEGVQVVIEKEW